MAHRLVAIALGLALALGVANAGLLLAALGPHTAIPAGLAALCGALVADAVTGLVHWACDTWGDERTRLLGPHLIRSFREHHRDPGAMLRHDWIEVNREPGVAAALALVLLSLPPMRAALAEHAALHAFLLALLAYGASANQLHLWAHAEAPPRPVRILQRCGLILAPEHHARHHRAPRTSAYCISTGWLNPALDALGFWRALERAITRLTGVRARQGATNG